MPFNSTYSQFSSFFNEPKYLSDDPEEITLARALAQVRPKLPLHDRIIIRPKKSFNLIDVSGWGAEYPGQLIVPITPTQVSMVSRAYERDSSNMGNIIDRLLQERISRRRK